VAPCVAAGRELGLGWPPRRLPRCVYPERTGTRYGARAASGRRERPGGTGKRRLLWRVPGSGLAPAPQLRARRRPLAPGLHPRVRGGDGPLGGRPQRWGGRHSGGECHHRDGEGRHSDGEGTSLWREAERAGDVQPGVEKAPGTPYSGFLVCKRGS